MKRHAAIVALVLATLGCKEDKPVTAQPTASAPAPVASASAAPADAAPAAAWYVGRWTGSYDAQHYLIETKKGEGLKQWADDDGKEGAGKGKLALDVKADGEISGSASGPLGEMIASGQAEDDSLRVTLRPKEPTDTAFQGFFVAKREGKGAKGRLQASSGDSLKVRDAPIELTRE
jgi:hypothetical protein